MNEEKDSFVFYRSFFEALQDLNDKDRLKLYDAICNLALNGEDTELKGITNTVFKLIKPQVFANTKRYVNGKKGGRPKKETIGYEKAKTTGYETKEPNVNENDNVNENVNGNDNGNVFGLFETEFCRTISPTEIDMINQWQKEHSVPVIKLALKEAVKNNARNFRYVEAILNNWKANGVRNETEALEYMTKREKEIKSKKLTDKQLPEWYYDQVEDDAPKISDAELAEKMKQLGES